MYVDTNYHFDMLRLVKVLEQHLEEDGDVVVVPEERVRACLRRLFVFLCSSSVQLLLTLHYLENTFFSRPVLLSLLLGEPEQRRGERGQAGSHTHEVFRAPGPAAKGLPHCGVRHHARQHQELRALGSV